MPWCRLATPDSVASDFDPERCSRLVRIDGRLSEIVRRGGLKNGREGGIRTPDLPVPLNTWAGAQNLVFGWLRRAGARATESGTGRAVTVIQRFGGALNLNVHFHSLVVCGHGAQEKTFAELKGKFALDVVPTNHYGANSAWQQLSILVYNLPG